jgi:hypothetical protein
MLYCSTPGQVQEKKQGHDLKRVQAPKLTETKLPPGVPLATLAKDKGQMIYSWHKSFPLESLQQQEPTELLVTCEDAEV